MTTSKSKFLGDGAWHLANPGKSLLLQLALPAVHTLALAWAVSYAWAAFVVPLGVVAIGFLHAWGLSVTLRLLSLRLSVADAVVADEFTKGQGRDWQVKSDVICIVSYAVAVLFMWIGLAVFGPVST